MIFNDFNRLYRIYFFSCFVIIVLLFVILTPSVSSASGINFRPERDRVYVKNGSYGMDDFRNLSTDIFEKKGDECYVKKSISVQEDASLHINGTYCKNLWLYPTIFVKIDGEIYFTGVRVSSYDPYTDRPITLSRQEYYHERPYIYTKAPAKYFYAKDSEFAYLGYYRENQEGSKWGLALYGLRGGFFDNVSIHNNYFGLYSYEAKNVVISNSKIYDNLEYGLDFHDYSDNFVVYGNEVYNNGNHGIIFSKYCKNNVIANNVVYNHTQNVFQKGEIKDYGVHGIMLHHTSTDTRIESNTLYNNRVGIYLADSFDNVVRDNIILNDLEHGMYISRSDNNLIENNIINETGGYSLYSYFSNNNTYRNNEFSNTTYFKGIYQGEGFSIESNGTDINFDEILREDEVDKEEKGSEEGEISSSVEYVEARIIFLAVLVGAFFLVVFAEIVYSVFRRING